MIERAGKAWICDMWIEKQSEGKGKCISKENKMLSGKEKLTSLQHGSVFTQ